jgi:DNA polymerase III subunit beta
MKITASKQSLLDALLVVSRAVSARAALQALSGILITLDGDARLRATDMELGLDVGLEGGEVEGTGAVVLPGRLLVEVVRSLPDGQVTLTLRESERDVEITAGSSKFHLRTLPADDFPRFPDAEGDPVELPAAALRDTINRVARAASRDEARPVLTGVLVTAEGDQLTMVATDSYRLAVKRTKLDSPVPERLEANVPARALRELARLIETAEDESLRVWLTRNQALFRVGEVSLSSRLIDGQFPNHEQLLPDSYEHEVKLPRAELLEVTRRVSQLAQRNAALRLSFSEGELVVSAETPDLGDAREALPAPYSGELLEIGFNPEFVRDGLESIDADEVVVKLISPLRPGLLEPSDSDDFSYLVMPIRLNV